MPAPLQSIATRLRGRLTTEGGFIGGDSIERVTGLVLVFKRYLVLCRYVSCARLNSTPISQKKNACNVQNCVITIYPA